MESALCNAAPSLWRWLVRHARGRNNILPLAQFIDLNSMPLRFYRLLARLRSESQV